MVRRRHSRDRVKIILAFESPEEHRDAEVALKAAEIVGALEQFRSWLDSRRDYGIPNEREIYNELWKVFHDHVGEYLQ
jgi:hypothetical protein